MSAWTFGDPALDRHLAPAGLESGATYEIKPVAAQPETARPMSLAARQSAAQAFAFRVAVRRCASLAKIAHVGTRRAPVLWCTSQAGLGELGCPHGHGLAALGFDPARLVLVTPPKHDEALWTAEEGLKSESLALVVVLLDEVGLTPARRLSLAARTHHTPCLILTHPETEAAASVSYRWRVGPAISAPHPFDPRAPGASRLAVTLERARSCPVVAEASSSVLEWSDEARRFRLVPGLAARPAEAVPTRRHSG